MESINKITVPQNIIDNLSVIMIKINLAYL